jgi:hypothetical protein
MMEKVRIFVLIVTYIENSINLLIYLNIQYIELKFNITNIIYANLILQAKL